MGDYVATRNSFDWKRVEKEFSWHHTGKVNIAYEAIDRHAEDSVRSRRFCLVYEDDWRLERISYHGMRDLSNKCANVLRNLGVRKGDRVFLFLPKVPEYYIAMVGCAKVGAICGCLLEGLMEVALSERLAEINAKVLITTPEMADRINPADRASIEHLVLVGGDPPGRFERDLSWNEEMSRAAYNCDIEWMDLEDPLYIVYTSGATGKPKGVVHVHNDMIGHLVSARWVLDLREDDVLWTTSDPGWITGTVYGAYAPWLCGVENFVRAGRFDLHKWCKAIESHGITVWYTAPTVLSRLMAAGEEVLAGYDLNSIRHLLCVGEPLPSPVVYWTKRVLGTPVHDTWWMTETGMIMIANFPGMSIKPGSIGKPLPGIRVAVIDADGREVPPLTLGALAIERGWPAMLRDVWNDREQFEKYFAVAPWYVSGDSAYVDDDGYYYFQGRDDDLIKVATVMVAPKEIEDAIRGHDAVADVGVIGKTDPLRGSFIKAFVSVKPGNEESETLQQDIRNFVRRRFSPRMVPREIEFRPEIPRSDDGSIVRRVLKAWDLGLPV
jgi:acetyl-CoA synthetase